MTSKKRKWKMTRTRKILLVVVTVLLIFRMLLPYIVLNYVNKKLANLTDYYGHVRDIDISLYRGAYIINDILLEKRESKDSLPFFQSSAIDLSVQWKAIFNGKVVGEIYVKEPILNFVKGKHKDEDMKQDTSDFKDLIKALLPLTINHFEIDNGQVHYLDPSASPRVDVAMKELYVYANNLSNVTDKSKPLPSNISANGKAYAGSFNLNADFDGLNKVPTFDLNAEVKDVNLVELNGFLQAYGNFEVKKGSFGLYSEFAAKEGNFGGYVKPILKDMSIVKGTGDLKQMIWEAIVAGGASILTNHNTDELATKVPISGKFNDPSINIWKAISLVLRNAFIHALKPSIDNTISINQLEDEKKKTFLEKIFGDGKKKKKDVKSSKDTNKK